MTIRVSDSNGYRLQEAAITLKQVSKDFPFGSAIAHHFWKLNLSGMYSQKKQHQLFSIQYSYESISNHVLRIEFFFFFTHISLKTFILNNCVK